MGVSAGPGFLLLLWFVCCCGSLWWSVLLVGRMEKRRQERILKDTSSTDFEFAALLLLVGLDRRGFYRGYT